jgi:hypothetical protein
VRARPFPWAGVPRDMSNYFRGKGFSEKGLRNSILIEDDIRTYSSIDRR